jgi:hypothetical protein
VKTSHSNRPAPKQPTPLELRDACLDFLRRKFYPDQNVAFAKDRPRLLKWVVLWPAKWLDEKGVTLPADRYREIFFSVFFDALNHGTPNPDYRPAWLAQVIQSHFRIQGERYYDEAKRHRDSSARLAAPNLAANIIASARPIDPVRDLAAAHDLLKPARAKRGPKKGPVNDQLSLL